MRYPKECPVFEVIANTSHHLYRVGTHVTAAHVRGAIFDCYDGEQLTALTCSWWINASDLRPLTPAAVDMLALVTP